MENEKLIKIMEMGYDVNIECKGKHRTYAMTFEATATKPMMENEEYGEYIMRNLGNHIHAVGDTIDELCDNLLERINFIENNKSV